jgi:hypothetical protein
MYSIRVWEILESGDLKLVDIVETDNKSFKTQLLKLWKELYLEYYKYMIEEKNNITQKTKRYTSK